ncbi:DUF6412 domain-containing protein [Streptomyces polyrhachis]|uniref:DUF6412 domain-containing protein n=1 Tax=Streptomyces polyrhachis TaxID=1282885 RepID=A0ABW2GEJ5_9ACTN
MHPRTKAVVRLLVGAVLALLGEAMYDEAGLAAAFTGVAASAALMLLGAAFPHHAVARTVTPAGVRTAIRERARRTAFLPQRDPDAAGRARPRAPGHVLPTAA